MANGETVTKDKNRAYVYEDGSVVKNSIVEDVKGTRTVIQRCGKAGRQKI